MLSGSRRPAQGPQPRDAASSGVVCGGVGKLIETAQAWLPVAIGSGFDGGGTTIMAGVAALDSRAW